MPKRKNHKLKGKSLKRAMAATDAFRAMEEPVPLIMDKTVHVTPEAAKKMLERNTANRPVNWNKVSKYKNAMLAGEWKLHAQGIVLDNNENILTGQNRLWAVIHAGIPQYLRVSTGSPPDTATLMDRHSPQTNRDLAARKTGRKHSPQEASIARAILALRGNTKPTPDDIGQVIVEYNETLELIVSKARRIKKTKGIYMLLAVAACSDQIDADAVISTVEVSAETLDAALSPMCAQQCWNKGAPFTFAMNKAWDLLSRGQT